MRNTPTAQCYAPVEISDVEEKEISCEQLDAIREKFSKDDIAIVMEDLNAKRFALPLHLIRSITSHQQ